MKTGSTTRFFFGDSWPYLDGDDELLFTRYALPWGSVINSSYELQNMAHTEDKGEVDYIRSITDSFYYPGFGLFNQLEWYFGGLPTWSRYEYPFWVPTGTLYDADANHVFLWYGKYIDTPECDGSILMRLNPSTNVWEVRGEFADRKFIQIAAVPVTIPTGNPAGLPGTVGEKGVLLYGTGPDVASYPFDTAYPPLCWGESFPDNIEEVLNKLVNPAANYRKSNVYLAYISIAHLRSSSFDDYIYYTDAGWPSQPNSVTDADPIFTKEYPLWGGVGEFSVQKVPGTNLLFMVYVTKTGLLTSRYTMRFADLSADPADFDCGGADEFPITEIYGYGNYILPASVQMVYEGPTGSKEYHLYYDRVASVWHGGTNTNYGTAIVRSVINFSSVWAECN